MVGRGQYTTRFDLTAFTMVYSTYTMLLNGDVQCIYNIVLVLTAVVLRLACYVHGIDLPPFLTREILVTKLWLAVHTRARL